jgi:nucleotide-binding universal stress UspA family protein
MTGHKPIIVGLPLDHQTDEILATALDLGQRLGCPVVVVHALGKPAMENERDIANRVAEAAETLAPRLTPLRDAGLDLRQVIDVGAPADLVIETAQRIGAQLIITGGGRPATIRRWLVGSVAEAIVRRALVPVWVARGSRTATHPVLCPVDLSPQSRIGLASAISMARLLGAPLRAMTVIDDAESDELMSEDKARLSVEEELAAYALDGLDVEIVVVSGSPEERIVDAADEAALLVIGSRGFDPLVPEWLGPVTTRALRHSHCSILAVREVDVDLERSMSAIAAVADAHRVAQQLIEDRRAPEALALIESAAQHAPFNATIQDTYAVVLKSVGREVEARARREIAKMIRRRIGPS